MKISAKLVMELRAKTNAGMMDCKKALIETEGDIQKAINYLREKGIMKAAKKAGRITAEGLVFAALSDDNKKGAILEFNTETDFVAKNKEFINFGNKIVNFILTNDFHSFEELNAAKYDDNTIKDTIANFVAKIGENMNIRRFCKEESTSFVTTYIHMGGQIGVLVKFAGEVNNENMEKGKNIAMHIAAMAPDFLDKKEVTDEIINTEKAILRKQLLEEGKPEKIIDNILVGKINKFYEENCLLQQKFVKDDKITVETYLSDIQVVSFTRYKLGEGIEKEEKDFASEVAAQIGS